MSCKICGGETKKVFTATILGKYQADYYQCRVCDFLCPDPITWTDEAYERPINISDTGCLGRNLSLSRRTFVLFLALFGARGRYLDYAGGYGILTRLMRDAGLDYYWTDKYAENLFASGFEFRGQKISAVTCFECFEHLANPVGELDKILAISDNLLFSTELMPDNTVPERSWWYYGFSHGQHIAFYSRRTLEQLAKKRGLNLFSGATIHLFTRRKINPIYYRFLLKLGRFPWEMAARLFLRSKTMSDSQDLIAKGL